MTIDPRTPATITRTPDGDILVRAAPATSTGPRGDTISPLELVNAVLRRRWFVARCAFWTALVVGLTVWGAPYSYSVPVSFTSQASGSSTSLAGLSGLAAQFGVSVPASSGGPTPDLYVSLLTTPNFLAPVVTSRFAFRDGPVEQNATYIDLYEITGDSRGRMIDIAVRQLMSQIAVGSSSTTGLVTATVTTDWPGLSVLLSRRLLQMVDSFNLGVRQQQARALEAFTTQRLERASAELHAAEDSMARFLQRNRDFSGAPFLAVERDRLQREIVFKQGVYSTLSQTYEQARVDAARNIPSIVVVQPAQYPRVPDPKKGKVKAMIALLFGAFFGVAWSLAAHIASQDTMQRGRDLQEFHEVLNGMIRDVTGFPRRVRERLRRRSTAR